MKRVTILEMKTQLAKVIREAGDLRGIEPYDYKYLNRVLGYVFTTEEGWDVHVEIERVGEHEYNQMEPMPVPWKNTYNVGYSVQGEQSQHTKTSYKSLIKILQTVATIVEEFTNKNASLIHALLFTAASKDPTKILTHTDPQKTALYKAVVLKNLGRLQGDWHVRDVKLDEEYNGFVLYRKDKAIN